MSDLEETDGDGGAPQDQAAEPSKTGAGAEAAVPPSGVNPVERSKTTGAVTMSLPRGVSQQRALVPTLQVIAGREMLRFVTVESGEKAVVGRGSECDLVLDDPSISRQHAEVSFPAPGRLMIKDLGSTNGVSVNGYAHASGPLRPGDLIELGTVSLRLDLLTRDELAHLRRVAAKLEAIGTDPLTGLRNRLWIDEELPGVLQRMDETERRVSGVFVDIDQFKQLNDQHGHVVGDAALRTMARIVLLELRDQDVCVRHGGDELFVVLPRTDGTAAAEVAERIRAAIARHDWSRTVDGLVVTASLGVAERVAGEDAGAWIARADRAMYAAKEAGRNGVQVG